MVKNKIMIFCSSFYPSYLSGGPPKSISNLTQLLQEDFDFVIVTNGYDVGDSAFKPFDFCVNDITVRNVKGAKVYYLLGAKKISVYKQIILEESPDALYLNSFFDFDFSIKVFLLRLFLSKKIPLLLAPRGELKKKAIQQKKIKKSLYLFLFKILNLDFYFHITAADELEAFSSKKKVGNLKPFHASNIPHLGNFLPYPRQKKSGSLNIVFFSRITPIKNLEFVLECINSLEDLDILLDIYGTIDDKEYWHSCVRAINKIKNSKICYKGSLTPDQVQLTLSNYHVFFVPSKSENFGHVFFEGMSAGCPLLLVRGATVWDFVEAKQAGWLYDLSNRDGFNAKLRELAFMDQKAWDFFSQNAYKEAQKFQDETLMNARDQYRNIFLDLIDKKISNF